MSLYEIRMRLQRLQQVDEILSSDSWLAGSDLAFEIEAELEATLQILAVKEWAAYNESTYTHTTIAKTKPGP